MSFFTKKFFSLTQNNNFLSSTLKGQIVFQMENGKTLRHLLHKMLYMVLQVTTTRNLYTYDRLKYSKSEHISQYI